MEASAPPLPKPVVKSSTMPPSLIQEVISCSVKAIEENTSDKSIAASIKSSIHSKYPMSTWNCFVGRDLVSIYKILPAISVLLVNSQIEFYWRIKIGLLCYSYGGWVMKTWENELPLVLISHHGYIINNSWSQCAGSYIYLYVGQLGICLFATWVLGSWPERRNYWVDVRKIMYFQEELSSQSNNKFSAMLSKFKAAILSCLHI